MTRTIASIIMACLATANAAASTLYVWTNSPSPAPPYDAWVNAARSIQTAIDYAQPADIIWVTNGVYNSGSKIVYGTMPNRIALDKALVVRSVNGPDETVIVGQGPRGGSAVRCAYLGTNAQLIGFTLSNGGTLTSGDISREQYAGGAWCEGSAILSNCVVSGCDAAEAAGGVYRGILQGCQVVGNTASMMGGCYDVTGYACIVSGNYADQGGGGVGGGTYYSCAIYRNRTLSQAGGCSGGIFYNCTIAGNVAGIRAGGMHKGTAYNCIVYGNYAPEAPNYLLTDFLYSCTDPQPPSGPGNISIDPQLASWSHLSSQSPCIGSGSTLYSSGVDIDGETWQVPPAMGSDEFRVGGLKGTLDVGILSESTLVATEYPLPFRADIAGRTTRSVWSFDDGESLTNKPEITRSWTAPGSKTIRLTAYNEDNPNGVSATAVVQVVENPIYYVNASNATPQSPFTNWASAAVDIQSAISAGNVAGRTVLVADGRYASGEVATRGHTPARIALTNRVVVRSLNGPDRVVIQGVGPLGSTAVRCAWVGDGSILEGITATGGCTVISGDFSFDDHLWGQTGGGVWCEVFGLVSNCLVTGCSAAWGGGGVSYGRYEGCTIRSNSSHQTGGGAYDAWLSGCTMELNRAGTEGGGAVFCTLLNCLVRSNMANGAAGGGIYSGQARDCLVVGNFAKSGGGIYIGDFARCVVTGNTASNSTGGFGGGAYKATLEDCVLSSNRVFDSGGGASDCTLKRCTLVDNWANHHAGGSAYGTQYNCVVYNNTAEWSGGGSYGGLLIHSTLVSNRAVLGGGGAAIASTLSNCIAYYNTAAVSNNYYASELSYSCATPLPEGLGNIDSPPVFAAPGEGDFRLAAGSAPIDAASASGMTVDRVNTPRPLDGNHDGFVAPDMGAFELIDNASDSDGDTMRDAWELLHGLNPISALDALLDPDGDLKINRQEWIADTDPYNQDDFFKILSVSAADSTLISISGSTARIYSLACATDLLHQAWIPVTGQTNLPGIGIMWLSDTNRRRHAFYKSTVSAP